MKRAFKALKPSSVGNSGLSEVSENHDD